MAWTVAARGLFSNRAISPAEERREEGYEGHRELTNILVIGINVKEHLLVKCFYSVDSNGQVVCTLVCYFFICEQLEKELER